MNVFNPEHYHHMQVAAAREERQRKTRQPIQLKVRNRYVENEM